MSTGGENLHNAYRPGLKLQRCTLSKQTPLTGLCLTQPYFDLDSLSCKPDFDLSMLSQSSYSIIARYRATCLCTRPFHALLMFRIALESAVLAACSSRASCVRTALTSSSLSRAQNSAPTAPAALAARALSALSLAQHAALEAVQTEVPSSPSSSTLLIPRDHDWAGAGREALVYKSLEEMVPIGSAGLSGRVFNAPVRPDLVHRVVHWQLAKRRAGTASTKTRSEVAGSGRKIRPQKGSGRSRQGALTSPLFRGGGRAHGPKPRDYDYPLPHGVRRNGLRSVLTSKFDNGQLWIFESASLSKPKTALLLKSVDAVHWRSALIVDHLPEAEAGVDASLRRASHNVQTILAMSARGINVYDLLSFDMLVLTLPALEHLHTRFENYKSLV
jgi:large subunit ribosomal protein L4